MSLKLISATPSPYARKVRIALAEKGIPFELQTEVPWNSTTQTKMYNPLEKLPVLIIPTAGVQGLPDLGKEKAVSESHFILEWLEARFSAPRYPAMLSEDINERLAAKEIEVVCDGVCDALVLRFFERQREQPSEAWIARQMRKVDGGIKWLATKLSHGKQFLVGDRFGLADIAAGAVCGYLDVRFPEYPWRTNHPNLALYIDGLQSRQSFKSTVPSPQLISDRIV